MAEQGIEPRSLKSYANALTTGQSCLSLFICLGTDLLLIRFY